MCGRWSVHVEHLAEWVCVSGGGVCLCESSDWVSVCVWWRGVVVVDLCLGLRVGDIVCV